MNSISVETKLRQIVSNHFTQVQVEAISALTPDASTRTYYRISVSGFDKPTIVAMCFDSLASPEYEGDSSVTADEAYIELSYFFEKHNVPVPKVFLDARLDGVLLIEDVGDELIAPLLLSAIESKDEKKLAQAQQAYRSAVSMMLSIQRIPLESQSIAESRYFSKAAYFSETLEFLDYIAKPSISSSSFEKEFRLASDKLCAEISSFPRVLAHRDFHGWNILLCEEQLRLIDFQDALMAPSSYDLVGLINDRDIDSALGRELYLELLDTVASEAQSSDEFLKHFSLVALQRDLKVAGRFAKLGQSGLSRYPLWIPGTLRRIGRTLEKLSSVEISYIKQFEILLQSDFSEISTGYKQGSWY